MRTFCHNLRLGLCAGALCLCVALTCEAAGPGRPTQNVEVVNTPLPVRGTVNVGNLPATQPVTGAVSISGTPDVTVVNTASNPLSTLDNSKNPANIVEILAQTTNGGSVGSFSLQGPDGNLTPFTSVPGDRALVITSADFVAEHEQSPLVNIQFGIVQAGALPGARVWVVSGTQSTSMSWPTGFVIGPGQTLAIGSSGDDVQVRFRGYFVPH